MDVAVMIEGQDGLNWARWQTLARAVEDLGFAALNRSDHFTNPEPPDRDALELWVSLTWLASHTQRIEFGPLVAPVSFRDPVMMARMALAVDDLSGGRLRLGLGAGWQEREHEMFGYQLLDVPSRLARFKEGVEVTSLLLRSGTPVSYNGTYYRLREARLLPHPQRPGGPPLVIGGGRGVLPMAARYADEWNVGFVNPTQFAALNARLDQLLAEQGREPGAVRRSVMVGVVFGRDEGTVRARTAERARAWGVAEDALQSRGFVVGQGSAIAEQLRAYAEAGVQRVMLQWLEMDDIDGLTALARDVLP